MDRKIHKYYNNYSIVDAIRLNVDNYKSVLRLIMKDTIKNDLSILNYKIDRNRTNIVFTFRYIGDLNTQQLFIGDFLVKNNNKLEVWKADKFLSLYDRFQFHDYEENQTKRVYISPIDISDYRRDAQNVPTFIIVKSFNDDEIRTSEEIKLLIDSGNALFVNNNEKETTIITSETDNIIIPILIIDFYEKIHISYAFV
jgi:hypothetical protein